MPRARRTAMLATGGVLLLTTTLTCGVIGLRRLDPRFDSADWQARDADNTRPMFFERTRLSMVEDLVATHLRRGKLDVAGVEALLGPPDYREGTTLEYTMEFEMWAMDPMVLSIEFDSAGRVAKTRIYES